MSKLDKKKLKREKKLKAEEEYRKIAKKGKCGTCGKILVRNKRRCKPCWRKSRLKKKRNRRHQPK